MAPSRRHVGSTILSAARAKKANASAGSLFFGGSEFLQKDDSDEVDLQDETYFYESDADEDAQCFDMTTAGRSSQAKKTSNPKGTRSHGGKAPPPKPIDSDYDSDDKRIIRLKKLGYKDDYVANKLVEEGRPQYSAKRIQTRWLRLKKIVDQKEEERLDDELSDWHIGEDDKLRECFNTLEAKYEVELLKLKERKWKDISSALAETLRVKKYTPKACKERWESLEDGTALLPIELDDDPEARGVLRKNRIAENKRRRDERKAAIIWTLGEKDRRAAEKRAVLEQKDRERQAERARKQAERDEGDRIKAEQRAGLEKKRAEQRAIHAEIKEAHKKKRNERKNADAMYMHYTGKKLNGRRDDSLIQGIDEDDSTDGSNSDIEMGGSMFDDEEKEPDMPHLTDAEECSTGEGGGEDNDVMMSETKTAKPARASKRKHNIKSNKTKVTLETLVNPRTIMKDNELAEVLTRRNLRRRTRGETHAQVVARIAAADATESVADLKLLLGRYFERRKGSREVLVRRLQEYDAAESELGMKGVTAIDLEFKRGYEGYRGKFAYAARE